jgi:hypothetical protein
MNETPLICRSQIKKLALYCAQQRARKFSRVGAEFYAAINEDVRRCVTQRVANHPSVGVTLK